MRENVRVIIFLSMRRTQSNKHLHTLIYDINISLFLCFFVWKKYLIPQKYRLFVVNKKKKEMCACSTFFSYSHTKKNMSLQYNHVKMAKENKSFVH
jgi:acetone carboxylase gamma subunit